MNKKSMFSICLTLFFFSCFVTKKNEGTYCSYGKWSVITLNNDSTYRYTKGVGWQYSYSEGFWSAINAQTLVLRSNFSDKKIKFSVSENYDKTLKDSLKFLLHIDGYNNEKPFYSLMLLFDGRDTLVQKCDSDLLLIKKGIAKKISLRLIADEQLLVSQNRDTLISNEYYFLNSQSNVFDINFNLDTKFFNFRVFNDDTIRIKKKSIYFRGDKLTRID